MLFETQVTVVFYVSGSITVLFQLIIAKCFILGAITKDYLVDWKSFSPYQKGLQSLASWFLPTCRSLRGGLLPQSWPGVWGGRQQRGCVHVPRLHWAVGGACMRLVGRVGPNLRERVSAAAQCLWADQAIPGIGGPRLRRYVLSPLPCKELCWWGREVKIMGWGCGTL